MDTSIQDLDRLKNQLKSLMRPKKLKMLVVDDEPDNLDLLYRTFRRDFQVFKAESGIHALDILEKEGEVAVIISDQRMPEMKGTEFLSKTLPQFPDTVRIILTGFTDVQDLVEAINSGQVYKYITKPWDPGELKAVVQRAADTYELLKQRTEELLRAQAQTAMMSTILQVAQSASTLQECLEPIATAVGENFATDGTVLQLVKEGALIGDPGCYNPQGIGADWFASDPLVQEAIATGQLQSCPEVSENEQLAALPSYQSHQIHSHFVFPVQHRNATFAVLSLQWQDLCPLQPEEVTLIHLAVRQIALALTSFQPA